MIMAISSSRVGLAHGVNWQSGAAPARDVIATMPLSSTNKCPVRSITRVITRLDHGTDILSDPADRHRLRSGGQRPSANPYVISSARETEYCTNAHAEPIKNSAHTPDFGGSW